MKRSALLAGVIVMQFLPAVTSAATISLTTRGDQEGAAGDIVFAECTLSTSADASTQTGLSTTTCPVGSAAAIGGADTSGILSLGAFAESAPETLASTFREVDASSTFTDTVIADGPTGQNGFILFTFPISGTFSSGSTIFLSGYSWSCGSGTGATSVEPVPATVTCQYATVFGSPTDVQFGLSVGVSSSLTTQTADFLHTATLSSIQLLDASMNPITGSIRSTTDFAYVLPATQTPEPGSLFLMGMALVGVMTRRGRRRV